ELVACEGNQGRIDDENEPRHLNEPARHAAVGLRQPLEAVIEAAESRLEEAGRPGPAYGLAGLKGLEQHRAESGAERERHEAGDHGRSRDRDGELAEKLAGDARDEG